MTEREKAIAILEVLKRTNSRAYLVTPESVIHKCADREELNFFYHFLCEVNYSG